MKFILTCLLTLLAYGAFAASEGDFLVKMQTTSFASRAQLIMSSPAHTQVEDLGGLGLYRVRVPQEHVKSFNAQYFNQLPGVVYVQPNYKVQLLENPAMAQLRESLDGAAAAGICDLFGGSDAATDNPAIPPVATPGSGNDPLLSSQWGMLDIGASEGWKRSKGAGNVIVAVIDTGVDYTHEDLVENLWRNPGETGTDAQGRDKSTNGIDDDGNGYVDDVIGWDFVSNDNKPFDLNVSCMQLLMGGNPGHGTHCAGNVAARGFNGKGISGVAPHVSIMSLRFLSETGQGTTDAAVKAILYAVNNGARVLSNSWGSEGEDPNDAASNKALREAIEYAQSRGALFIAAAGNGHQGVGYDNDTDAKPAYPASYPHDIIVSVAALDSQNALGSFSNWGRNSVDLGAPGVAVFSTTVLNKYSDTVLDLSLLGMPKITWDGTSMATPHVAGAAALYWSYRPQATWQEVKSALISTVVPIPALQGKSVSGGKLNVQNLMSF